MRRPVFTVVLDCTYNALLNKAAVWAFLAENPASEDIKDIRIALDSAVNRLGFLGLAYYVHKLN